MTVDALRSSPVLAGLDDDALARLAESGAELQVPEGTLVLQEGHAADAMYVLLEGELEARKRVGDGDAQVGVVGPGELIGELALLHGRPRSAAVHASKPSRLLRIPAEALDELLGNAPASRALLATATRRLERQELLLQQHSRMSTLGNLTAGLLHELNNPASAVGRAVRHLGDDVRAVGDAERDLAERASPALVDGLEQLEGGTPAAPADPLARADAEERWGEWLEREGVADAWKLSGPLSSAGVDPDAFAAVVDGAGSVAVGAAARWLAARLSLRRALDEAATGARRIAEIVGAVKAYSHHGEAPVGDVDVRAGLESSLTLLRHKVPDGVAIVRRYGGDVPRIEGYPGDLNAVWTNLIDNALDAVGAHGTITLATRAEPGAVVVEVADDGPGVPPGIADRLFDPFFTTKPVGEGTGLGLATSDAIVRQCHRGRITVDSVPGRTTMTVRLPVGPGARPSGKGAGAEAR